MTHKKTDHKVQKRARIARWVIAIFILVLITILVNAHQYMPGVEKPPGVDALCPFGGLETIYSLITGEGLLKKTAAASLLLLVGAILMTLVFRRSFCGHICPLGTLQSFFGSINRKFFKKHPIVPKNIDRIARYLKYIVLVFFLGWTWYAGTLVMRPYDPWAAYAHIASDTLFTEILVGFIVLIVSLIGSLVYERFFCKYLCPMGAFLGLFSKASIFRINRDKEECISCGRCDKACPMNIPVSTGGVVNATECISCNECVNSCPVAGALEIETPKGKTVPALVMTGIVVALLAAVIGLGAAAETFNWEIPWLSNALNQLSEEEEGDPLSYIKGSVTMEGISATSGIAKEEFIAKWGVSDTDYEMPLKDIKETYGFTVDDMKIWVANKLGIDLSEIILEGETTDTGAAEGGVLDTSFITGSISMLQIADTTGITKEQFIEKWGIAETDYEKPLKDIKDQYGFEVGDIQAWVAEIGTAAETETVPATTPDVDVSYIKGSSTMEGVSETSGIPKERFIEKWGVSDADYKKPLKDIKDIYGFDVGDIQTWVAEEIG